MDNGGAGGFWENFGILLPIIILILLSTLFRRRQKGGGGTQQDIAFSLLSEVEQNLKIADSYSADWQIRKKFQTVIWNRNQDKIDFLDQGLRNNLRRAFSLAEEYNQRIDESKRYKSTSYMAAIETDKLIEPLTKSKEGLTEWLQANLHAEMPQQRRGPSG
jgi:hypothetical protein